MKIVKVNNEMIVPKIALVVLSSASVSYLSANIAVIVAVGMAHSKIASFANMPLTLNVTSNDSIKSG